MLLNCCFGVVLFFVVVVVLFFVVVVCLISLQTIPDLWLGGQILQKIAFFPSLQLFTKIITILLSVLDAGTNKATTKTSNHTTYSSSGAEAGFSHPSILPQDTACRTQEDSEWCDPQCCFWGSSQQVYPAPAGSCCWSQSQQVQVGGCSAGIKGYGRWGYMRLSGDFLGSALRWR